MAMLLFLYWLSYVHLHSRPTDAPLIAYTAAAAQAWVVGDLTEAERVGALAAERYPDETGRADLFEILGDVDLSRSAVGAAVEKYKRAESIHRSLGEQDSRGRGDDQQGSRPRLRRRRRSGFIDEALAAAAATGNPTTMAFARYVEAEICVSTTMALFCPLLGSVRLCSSAKPAASTPSLAIPNGWPSWKPTRSMATPRGCAKAWLRGCAVGCSASMAT